MGGRGEGDASGMQLGPRFCHGIGQGARSPGVQGVIGRLSAGVYMANWALRAFDPSAYCILGSRTVYEQKRARCNMRGTAHAAFPHGAAQRYERDPPQPLGQELGRCIA